MARRFKTTTKKRERRTRRGMPKRKADARKRKTESIIASGIRTKKPVTQIIGVLRKHNIVPGYDALNAFRRNGLTAKRTKDFIEINHKRIYFSLEKHLDYCMRQGMNGKEIVEELINLHFDPKKIVKELNKREFDAILYVGCIEVTMYASPYPALRGARTTISYKKE